MKFKVSVSEAIKKAKSSAKRWEEKEARGEAHGFSQARERHVAELKRFRGSLKKHRDNPDYMCKDMSGYINVLQNNLFHAKFLITDEKIKARLNKVHDELAILFYLLDEIDIVP